MSLSHMSSNPDCSKARSGQVGRWCDKPGGAIDVPPCGQTRRGGERGDGVGWGGGRSVSVLTLARTFSKEAGLTREKHIKNTSWERTREMAS